MKYIALSFSVFSTLLTIYSHAETPTLEQQTLANYLQLAQQKQLAEQVTWKRLLYAEGTAELGSNQKSSIKVKSAIQDIFCARWANQYST